MSQYTSDFDLKIVKVSAGFGHTAVITDTGDIYSWGLNLKGQLGLGDKKSRYFPEKLTKDILCNDLPKFNFLSCGYHNTFAISVDGKLFSWGSGNIGQKDETLQDMPRKIEAHTEGRLFSKSFSISNSTIIFAPMRIASIRPLTGPSTGGTMLNLIGTGFTNTAKQSVRFTFGKFQIEVGANFESNTDCFHCMTPKFDECSVENI